MVCIYGTEIRWNMILFSDYVLIESWSITKHCHQDKLIVYSSPLHELKFLTERLCYRCYCWDKSTVGTLHSLISDSLIHLPHIRLKGHSAGSVFM
jgi:hypothetical protein